MIKRGVDVLLRRVAARRAASSAAAGAYAALLVLAGVYAAGLVLSRLLGLIPDWLDPLTLATLPPIAAAAGLLLRRRPPKRSCARLVDAHADPNDLFLTAATVGPSAAEFVPLVYRSAEEKAGASVPRAGVPWRPWRRARRMRAARDRGRFRLRGARRWTGARNVSADGVMR